MASYKPPHYITIGIHILAKTPDGKIVGIPMAVEEVGEIGIEAMIEKVVRNLIETGVTPLTQEEYDTWSQEMAAFTQSQRLAEAMHERAKHVAIDPERIEQIMAAHKGRVGGDA